MGTQPAGHDDQPLVAVVIVTYNSGDVLTGCLESLSHQGVRLSSVVVVDNASRDDSVPIAEGFSALPMRTVQMGRNAGYAAAVNAGLATIDLAKNDAVLILNADIKLRPETIRILADALRQPRRGTVVPLMVNPDGSLQPSLRRMPSVRGVAAEAIFGGRRAGRLGGHGELITDPRAYEKAGPAIWATGAALLLSAAMIQDIGVWDESFLLYSEETEYALRGADRGWSLWFEPAAVVEHVGGDSGTNPLLASLLIVNKVILFQRRRGWLAGSAYRLSLLAGEGVRAAAGRRASRASVLALLRPGRRAQIIGAITGERP